MQDPSRGVAPELLPHVHCLSVYRFPVAQQTHPEQIAKWLLSAPKIARDTAPFYWTYLDRPADGMIVLTWQPPSFGPMDVASDGYVWAGMETSFQIEVQGGYILEMHQYKTGFAPGEPVATHSRRRYRLLPPKFQTSPDAPQPNPSLWIIHYSQSDMNDRIQSAVIPVDNRTNQIMQARAFLQSQGQIVRRDFMLHDVNNWPQIQAPRPQQRQPIYSGNMPQPRVPQAMAYPPQAPPVSHGPPASKRQRTAAAAAAAAAASAAEPPPINEEDDSRGDMFDLVTPREISLNRFKQNHEWMEEILSSPYAINQIVPVDLGLGLSGELGPLTEGIFYAPGKTTGVGQDQKVRARQTDNFYIGKLDPVKADLFRTRAQEHIDNTNSEIEKMKAKHAKKMAKFRKNSAITLAEKELRTAVSDPTDSGTDFWRLEGRIEIVEDDEEPKPVEKHSKVDDIVAQIEASLGRQAVVVQEILRIQDGGLEERAPEPTPIPEESRKPSDAALDGALVGDTDMDMGGSAAGLLDEFHTGFSANTTPNNFPTPGAHAQANSSVNTPAMSAQSPQPPAQSSASAPQVDGMKVEVKPEANASSGMDVDVEMGGTSADHTNEANAGDWVVVPPGGMSPTSAAPAESAPPASEAANPTTSALAPPPPTPAVQANNETLSEPTLPTPADAPAPEVEQAPPQPSTDFSNIDVNDSLANFNPGDAGGMGSESMDAVDLGGDLDLGMDLGLDDSAFGDAFHGVETRDGDDDGGM